MDSNKIDFKKIWDKQEDNHLSLNELFKKIKQKQRQNNRKNIITVVLLLLTMFIIVKIGYHFKPQLFTSKIGLTLILFSITFLILILSKNSLSFYRKNLISEKSNSDYLEALVQLKEKQRFMQTKVLNYYFVSLFSGVLFLTYEFTSQTKQVWLIIAYIINILWIILVYLIIRPRLIKRQNMQIDEIIEKIQAVKNQLEN